MITEDYIMRMIKDMSRMLAVLMFGKKGKTMTTEEQMQLASASRGLPLTEQLNRMADEGRINDAEDRLFDELDFSEPAELHIAMAFYEHLNSYGDAFLERHDYSREEILEGLRDCAVKFGVDESLLDVFHP